MKLEIVDLFSESAIRHEFLIGESKRGKSYDILVIRYSGVYRVGSGGNADTAFMLALAKAAISYTDPDGIVLDISELDYQWGDEFEMVFSLGSNFYPAPSKDEADQESEVLYAERMIPQATIIGAPCKKAVRTLLLGEYCGPDESLEEFPWLFESFDDAWNYVEEEITLGSRL